MEHPLFRDLERRYLGAQLAGDRQEALRLILDEGLGAGATVRQLLLDVICPAQHRIGELRAVRMLGASVPIPSLLARVAEEPPDALLLSATMAHHVPALRATVAYLGAAGSPRFLVLAGGQAVASAPDLLGDLGLSSHEGEHARLAGAIVRALAAPSEAAA